jgi:hypothetical protein
MSDKVASATFLCTPHKGSAIAERLYDLPKFIRGFIAFNLNLWYRILGDIICDIDDMYRAMGLKKNLLHPKGDSKQMKIMLAGISQTGDYKTQIIRNCINIIRPFDRKKITLDYAEVVKCAVALGKRQFALEVLPYTVLELALDRSHVYKSKEEKSEKKRWFRR